MKRAIRYTLLLMLAAALFLAGIFASARRTTNFWLSILEYEVVGSLYGSVETLANLELGEVDTAQDRLEGRLQSAVISLTQQHPWAEMPEGTRAALVLAEAYLERYPPQDALGGLDAALAAIPDEPLDLESRSPAVRRLLAEMPAGLRLEELAPGVWRHVSHKELPGYGPFPSNGLVVDLGDGSLLVDTAYTTDQTRELIDWAEARVGPVRAVVVTHAHDDRMGGISEVERRGIPSYGLELTARLGVSEKLGQIDHTFTDRLDLDWLGLAGEVFWPGPGHAPDNVVVWLADSRILFGGCFVKSADATSLGNTADADLGRWAGIAAKVGERYRQALTVVPGHGGPGGVELLEHTRELVAGHVAGVRRPD